MKKNSVIFILTIATFLLPVQAFATEAETPGTTEKTSAALETSPSPSSEELPKVAPIAQVSDGEKAESEASSVKAETAQAKTVAHADASAILHEEKSEAVHTQTDASSVLNPAEMQRRWKALFSKEITPDSLAYTVKPGDSLYVLARKNHTTIDFIKKINGLKSDNLYPRMKLKIHTAPFSIEIDKSKNVLVLYSNGEAVKKYSVATGKKNCTPVGEFKITDKLVHPTWFKTGAILPPGSPENALGTRWMGFDKPSYGIHGTIEPKSIGTQASEGCIRMLNEEVEELYSLVPVGTKVTIQD